jgi:hypothetical protein
LKQPCRPSLIVRSEEGFELLELFNEDFIVKFDRGLSAIVKVAAAAIPLLPGSYRVDLWLGDRSAKTITRMNDAYVFRVLPSRDGSEMFERRGACRYRSLWSVENTPQEGQERVFDTISGVRK